MARPLRLEFPGVVYHVTSRGNARQAIFLDKDDRESFLGVLSSVVARFNWLCHGGGCYHRSKMDPGNSSKWTHLRTTGVVPKKAKTFIIDFPNALYIDWLEHLENRLLPRGNKNRVSLGWVRFPVVGGSILNRG